MLPDRMPSYNSPKPALKLNSNFSELLTNDPTFSACFNFSNICPFSLWATALESFSSKYEAKYLRALS